jgi:DNA-binding MarR family transcriptional regulator
LYTDNHDNITFFLSEIFHNILRNEECSHVNRADDTTFKEIHVIEAVARLIKNEKPARASKIAHALHIAPGTLTASVDVLEKKGYLTRIRDKDDRRSIRITLTEAGKEALEKHRHFHRELTDEILAAISSEEARVLVRSLDIIRSFFDKKIAAKQKSAVKIIADSTCDIDP